MKNLLFYSRLIVASFLFKHLLLLMRFFAKLPMTDFCNKQKIRLLIIGAFQETPSSVINAFCAKIFWVDTQNDNSPVLSFLKNNDSRDKAT